MRLGVPFAVFAVVGMAIAWVPQPAIAKDRGCDNRLVGLYEAERNFDIALRRREGVDEARAAFMRAREKAGEEGCLVGTQWDRGTKYDRDNVYQGGSSGGSSYFEPSREAPRSDRGRRAEERRFDELVQAGYRGGLSRDEFAELEALRRRLER